MGDFGVFPAPGQADFLQLQWHLRRWAENFQKVWYGKKKQNLEIFLKNFWAFQKYILGMLGPRSRSEIVFFRKKSPKMP